MFTMRERLGKLEHHQVEELYLRHSLGMRFAVQRDRRLRKVAKYKVPLCERHAD